MNDIAILRILDDSEAAVFSTQQLAVILDVAVSSARVKLSRLAKRGTIKRIMQGVYTLPSADIFTVASGIYQPSYVSLLSAFEHYGTTVQSSRIIDVINPVKSGRIKLALDAGAFEIRFVKVHPKLIYGFSRIRLGGKTATLAEKEKAIVDGLLFAGYVPLDEILSCIRSGIDRKKVTEYAVKTGRQSVMKRLGYLLNIAGIDSHPADFGTFSATYVPLTPGNAVRGKHSSSWRVIINGVVS